MLFVPLAVLVVIAITLVPSLMARIATLKTKLTAPMVSISTLEGQEVNSSNFRNHVVIIDYWATWCLPCRRELSQLEPLYRQYQGSSSVSFWAVDIQAGGETPEKARVFMERFGYTIPVAFDSHNTFASLKLGGPPSLFVMDPVGRIRLIHTGYDISEPLQSDLRKEIDALLSDGERRPAFGPRIA